MKSATILWALLLWANPAWANQPPGPQVLLGEILILPLMMLFTAIGGGYAVMRARGIKRPRLISLVAVAAIVLSGAQEGYGVLVACVFGIVALERALRMMGWGIAAAWQRGERKPDVAQAAPLRLIAAGLLTLLTTVGLVGLSFVFVGWWPSEHSVDEDLKRVVAYQMARGKEHSDAKGNPEYEAPKPQEPGNFGTYLAFENLETPRRSYFATEFRLGPEARSFRVWVWPRRMPRSPYNYLVTLPSFYADESGQVRMIRVHHAGQRCPADALVYDRVRPEDRQPKR